MTTTVKTTPEVTWATDDLWLQQQACDELVSDCDEIITKQAQLYKREKDENARLNQELQNLAKENFKLNNPPWYEQPQTMALMGIIIGIFSVKALETSK